MGPLVAFPFYFQVPYLDGRACTFPYVTAVIAVHNPFPLFFSFLPSRVFPGTQRAKLLWKQELYIPFKYTASRTFFHTFPADVSEPVLKYQCMQHPHQSISFQLV